MSVITHSRFNPDLKHLQDLGVEVEVSDTYEGIDLPEPQFGETILGALTEEERALFVELFRVNAEIERLAREYVGRGISKVGDRIRSSDTSKPLAQSIQDGDMGLDFGTDGERLAFFRFQQRGALVHATLYWSLGERFGAHDWRIGVRTKFRAVKIQPRA